MTIISSTKVCRPPFNALYIMSVPWLSRFNDGKVPHIGVFSTKQILQFKGKGRHQNNCVYLSEDSAIPSSILDGTARSASAIEGREVLARFQSLELNGTGDRACS